MSTRFTPGELTVSQAAALNELARVAEQFSRLTVAAPLSLSRPAGIPSIRFDTSRLSTGIDVDSWKQTVRVATTANGTLASAFENGDTIDGVTLATGDRILIKNQTTKTENGIYTVNASGAPTRGTDADDGSELVGAVVFVSEGTTNADSIWACITNAPITLGSTDLVFTKISGPLDTTTSDAGGPSTPINITADSTWTAHSGVGPDLTITLPGPGTYLLCGRVTGYGYLSANQAPPGASILMRLFNTSSSTEIPNSVHTVNNLGNSVTPSVGHTAFAVLYVATSGDTIRIEAYRTVPGTGTWSVSQINGTDVADGEGGSTLSAIRLGQ